MARILFLPDDSSVIRLQSPLTVETLLAQIHAQQWQPPPPYEGWVKNGGFALSCAALGNLVIIQVEQPGHAPTPPTDLPVPSLSPREQQVLQYLAEGLKQADIARRLGISRRTVTAHVHSIKSRLGMRTTAQTIGRAAALGWVRMKRREEPRS